MDALCTLTTHGSGERCLDRFLASCARHGADPVRLGLGLPFTGMMLKPKLLHAYLADHPGVDRVAWVDAYDSVLQAPMGEFWDCWGSFGRDLVFSTEKAVWPLDSLAGSLPDGGPGAPYRGVCAGGWAGTRAAALRLLGESTLLRLPDDFSPTDQLPTQLYLISNPGLAAVDHRMALFGSLCRAEGDFAYGPGRVWNRRTRTLPCVIHGNGKADLGPACEALGY